MRLDRAVQPVEDVVERLRHLADFVLACGRIEPDGELALGDSRGAMRDADDRRERARGEPVAERRGRRQTGQPRRSASTHASRARCASIWSRKMPTRTA